ncbi:MAG: helix-turn-helix domain-containing protein [Paraclostridium sp.]
MGIIAQRITQARKDLNLKQKELATKADITEANLSRYENGIREPKSAVLIRLADALEVTTDYLVGLTDEKNYDGNDITKIDDNDVLALLQNLENRLESSKSGISDTSNKPDESDKSNKPAINFCGQPASKEAIDGILHAIRAGIIMAINDTKNNNK